MAVYSAVLQGAVLQIQQQAYVRDCPSPEEAPLPHQLHLWFLLQTSPPYWDDRPRCMQICYLRGRFAATSGKADP